MTVKVTPSISESSFGLIMCTSSSTTDVPSGDHRGSGKNSSGAAVSSTSTVWSAILTVSRVPMPLPSPSSDIRL